MTNLALSVTFLGLILNFLGTVMLVFSLPAFLKQNKSGELCVSMPLSISAQPVAAKNDTFKSLEFVIDLFIDRVIKDKDISIICALVLLVLGNILQGYGVWLSVTDC